MGILVPAVLPTSRKDLEEKLALFARMENISRVQIDSVDGKFASPACWPYTDADAFRKMSDADEMLPLLDRFEYEIDLMCLDAERAGELWLSLGATRLTFHAEATTDLPRLLAHMHERHGGGPQFAERLVSFGAAIGIETDVGILEASLDQLDYVQFMGIAKIGKQGQPFDTRVYERVRRFHAKHPEVPVQIDGGANFDHAKRLVALGAGSVIVGSALLKSSDPIAAAALYESIGSSYGV